MYQKHQNRTIKTTISQQYTSFVFPFAETRSIDVTSVNRENRPFPDKALVKMWNVLTESLQGIMGHMKNNMHNICKTKPNPNPRTFLKLKFLELIGKVYKK